MFDKFESNVEGLLSFQIKLSGRMNLFGAWVTGCTRVLTMAHISMEWIVKYHLYEFVGDTLGL